VGPGGPVRTLRAHQRRAATGGNVTQARHSTVIRPPQAAHYSDLHNCYADNPTLPLYKTANEWEET
jgi:hypothetical protein